MGEVMKKVAFDKLCREEFECPNYVEWDETLVMDDHNRQYESVIECASCLKVGQSYNIDEYPECCAHKKAIDKYVKKAIAKRKLWKKQQEQDKIWKKLNAID